MSRNSVARGAGDRGGPRGFSRRNLFYMRRFATIWPDREKVQPLSAQIGWTHHQVLIDAFGDDRNLYAWAAAVSVLAGVLVTAFSAVPARLPGIALTPHRCSSWSAAARWSRR